MPCARAPLLACLAAGSFLGATPRADDMPSPDAMWLGGRIVPRTLVEGFRDGITRQVLEGALAGQPDRPASPRAGAALAPLLDEAFPEELLAGVAAQFLARHYSAEELRALRAREDSPLGRKLRDFYRRAASLTGADASTREALAGATFTEGERKELDAFAASPLGRKGDELALVLAGFFLEQLDRRWAEVRRNLEPRLRTAAKAALESDAPGR